MQSPNPARRPPKKRLPSRKNRTYGAAKPVASPILLAFNKPFDTLCQFTGEPNEVTLADFIDVKNVYPAGRLDKDSEGLLLLTNDGSLQNRISHPRHKLAKTYWAQVEGQITPQALAQLSDGVLLKDGMTRKATAREIDLQAESFELWQRQPPIRERKNIPTSWLELIISEGKNRQVRRMTAAVGFPTLRLIRMAIGEWKLAELQPGQWTKINL